LPQPQAGQGILFGEAEVEFVQLFLLGGGDRAGHGRNSAGGHILILNLLLDLSPLVW
jgi:hypothetical protein